MGELLRLESVDERKFVKYAEEDLGLVALKLNRRGWPDRFIQLMKGYGFYIEFKRKGQKPRKLQEHFHKHLRALGCHVYVCDTFDQAVEVLQYETDIALSLKSTDEMQ